MPSLRLFFLGPPQVEQGGQAVIISLRKALALLAYLAVTGQPHTRDALATLLWPESNQRKARANLRRTLHAINDVLGATVIESSGEALFVAPEARCWLDVVEFTAHVAACLDADTPPPDCLARLQAAATLYRDDFLAGFTLPDSPEWDEWQFFQQEALRHSLARVLEMLVDHLERASAWEEAIPHARRLLALDPFRETAHRSLMRLYAHIDQQAAAIRQYEQCERVLLEELGASPGEETVALYEAIRARRFPPAGAPARTRAEPEPVLLPQSNLPVQATPFVGREQEVADIRRRLEDEGCRLLTLVGPGGIGKTRLALEAARQMLEDPGQWFPNGVYFVPLAAIHNPEEIVPAIAESVAFRPRDPSPVAQQLIEYLQSKQILLILDNVEQLLEPDLQPDGAEVITSLLGALPRAKLLVTSRQALNVREEWFHSVLGMAVPSVAPSPDLWKRRGIAEGESLARYDALRLFEQSARRVQQSFSLEDEFVHVLHICRLVEGMPLAIELAAAWLKLLTAEEIAAEIARNLDILTTRARNVPARHRSMRAVLDQSWAMLDEREAGALRQLSVFRDGFTHAAASAVAGASLMTLASLVDKALLRLDSHRRYRFHELLRQYAAERLAERPEEEHVARDRHSAFYCACMERWLGEIEGAHKRRALEEMDLEWQNIQQAWQWAARHVHVDRLEQALRALEHYGYWRGRYHETAEAYRIAVEAVEARLQTLSGQEDTASRQTLAHLLARHANCHYLFDDLSGAEAIYRRVLAMLERLSAEGNDTRLDRAYTLIKMGDLPDDPAQAEEYFQESFALFREVGHDWWTAGVLTHLGHVALARAEYDAAEAYLSSARAAFEAIGDRWELGWVLDGASNVALHKQQWEKAEQLAQESLAIHREIGLRDRTADNLTTLSWIALARGDTERARALYQEAQEIWRDLGSARTLAPLESQDAQPYTSRWFRSILAQRLRVAAGQVGV